MSKRSLLIGSMCLVASCNLYEELQVPTYDSLRPGQRDDAPAGEAPDFQPDGPSLSVDAGAAADSGSPDAASDSGVEHEVPAAGSGGASAAGRGGAAAAGSGGAISESGAGGSAAGSSAAGNSAAGSGGGGAGSAGAAGSSTTDPACIADGGQTWSGNGHCYFLLLTQATWNVSRDECASADAKLAAITSIEELDFVTGLLVDSAAWIGFSKFGAPQFSWSTGEANGYTNWAAGEPNLSGEAAVAMHHDTGKWFDDAVNATHPAICERP